VAVAIIQKNIEEKLKNLLTTNSLSQIANMYQENFSIPLDQLKVKIGEKLTLKICFFTGNKRVCYSIRDKNDHNRAKEIFSKYLAT